MDYIKQLCKIKKSLSTLDSTPCNTIEEAKLCLTKYDKLKDDIIKVIASVSNDSMLSNQDKEEVYVNGIRVLTNYIGNADDVQKYGKELEHILGDTKMMKAQLDFFYNSLDIGRWL